MADEYTEDQRPCMVAKMPCGCFVAAAGLDQPMSISEIDAFYEEVKKWTPQATIEFRPVSFVRNGALNFTCEHK